MSKPRHDTLIELRNSQLSSDSRIMHLTTITQWQEAGRGMVPGDLWPVYGTVYVLVICLFTNLTHRNGMMRQWREYIWQEGAYTGWTWGLNDTEIFSALLALCESNLPIKSDPPQKGLVI